MAQDFSRYLDVDVDSIPKTIPSLPIGHYFADIQAWKGDERYYEGKAGPATPVVSLTFKITGADHDVDFSDGGMTEGSEVGKLATKDYTLNDPDKTGQVMLRRLAEETCGLDVKGLSLVDVLDALKGQSVRIYNEPRAGKEEGQFFVNIKKVLPAHD